jgi:hypothetical protein
MKFLAGLAVVFLALAAMPAQAQTTPPDAVMRQLDLEDLRAVLGELDLWVNKEGVDEEGDYFLEVETADGLVYHLFGASCDDDDPAKACLGLNMVATFSLKDAADIHAVMDGISYAFLKVYRAGDEVKIARYVIFDGGITRDNMKANISVFSGIAKAVWSKLTTAGVLEN